jgi:MFS family permease
VPALSPDDAWWSHSDFCPSWGYVRDFTQRLTAGRTMSLTLTSLFFMPIGAGLADKQGRKPIFFFGFIMGMKGLLCNLLSSTTYFIHKDPNAILLYASGLLSGMASGGGPVSMAMMVDVIPGDMREQVRCF